MLWRKPIQMHDASRNLQIFDHGYSFAVAGILKHSQGWYPLEECCFGLLKLACHRRFFLQPIGPEAYFSPHSQSPSFPLLFSFSSNYFLPQLVQTEVFHEHFLVKVDSPEQLSQFLSPEQQIWSWLSVLLSLNHCPLHIFWWCISCRTIVIKI